MLGGTMALALALDESKKLEKLAFSGLKGVIKPGTSTVNCFESMGKSFTNGGIFSCRV